MFTADRRRNPNALYQWAYSENMKVFGKRWKSWRTVGSTGYHRICFDSELHTIGPINPEFNSIPLLNVEHHHCTETLTMWC